MINHLPILIIIFPLTVAFIILLFKKYTPYLSAISILFSLISLLQFAPSVYAGGNILYHLGGWQGPLGISLLIDGLSFIFAFTVLLIGMMVTIYSIPEKKYNHNYYFLFPHILHRKRNRLIKSRYNLRAPIMASLSRSPEPA